MKVAIVGVTGLVGNVMLKVLEERDYPISELLPVATENSVGKYVKFKNTNLQIIGIEEADTLNPDIAIFSAGSNVSWLWAPIFANNGTFVIDNSSAWRMDDKIKLIVPELNANLLSLEDKIIANPNCSTIQMVMVLGPLNDKYKIKRIIVSTYQSVSGSGARGIKQLENERLGKNAEMFYPYQIDKNCLPHCDEFSDDGYTKEELKLVNETRKILNNNDIQITATAVRVPVTGGHSESVNIEFENDFTLTDVREILQNKAGIIVQDDNENLIYPQVKYAEGKDEVFVGRIRRDYSQKNSLNLWIVADNLRKGAATNAVQIAEYLLKHNFVKV